MIIHNDSRRAGPRRRQTLMEAAIMSALDRIHRTAMLSAHEIPTSAITDRGERGHRNEAISARKNFIAPVIGADLLSAPHLQRDTRDRNTVHGPARTPTQREHAIAQRREAQARIPQRWRTPFP